MSNSSPLREGKAGSRGSRSQSLDSGRCYVLYPASALLAFLLASCSKPAPLNTSFRRSALDSAGLVLQVRNTSSKSLSCAMTATNKTDGQDCRYSFSLAPSGFTEIGIVEAGWSFKSGESVRIDVEGHRSLSLQVP